MKVDIDCVEEIPGQAKTILSMKNYCEEYATQEQIEEIKELVRQRKAGAGCQGEDVEGEDVKGEDEEGAEEEGEEKEGMHCRSIAKLQLYLLADSALMSINSGIQKTKLIFL